MHISIRGIGALCRIEPSDTVIESKITFKSVEMSVSKDLTQIMIFPMSGELKLIYRSEPYIYFENTVLPFCIPILIRFLFIMRNATNRQYSFTGFRMLPYYGNILLTLPRTPLYLYSLAVVTAL